MPMVNSLYQIIGHRETVSTLINAIISNKVAHAYLFVGPVGVGKSTTAKAFAKTLLCEHSGNGSSCGSCRNCLQVGGGNHPDLHVLSPGGATIKLEQVQQLQKQANYRSYQGGYQVYIISQCDLMTPEAANSLLKTLEEPPGNVVYILVSSRPYAVLPTILSRCQQFWFKSLPEKLIMEGLERHGYTTADNTKMLCLMAGGSLGRALELAEGNIFKNREEALARFKWIDTGDVVELLRQSAELAADRTLALGWIELIQLWIRDLLIWKITKEKTLIINIDLLDKLDSQRYTIGRLVDMMEGIELARTRLEARGNTRLVMDVLLLNLANLTEGKRRLIG